MLGQIFQLMVGCLLLDLPWISLVLHHVPMNPELVSDDSENLSYIRAILLCWGLLKQFSLFVWQDWVDPGVCEILETLECEIVVLVVYEEVVHLGEYWL